SAPRRPTPDADQATEGARMTTDMDSTEAWTRRDADADWLHDEALAGRLLDRCQTVAERIRAALRSEAQGEERASKCGALLAFADVISDAVWGGERAWEQDGGLERLSQKVRRWAKERAARRGEGGGK